MIRQTNMTLINISNGLHAHNEDYVTQLISSLDCLQERMDFSQTRRNVSDFIKSKNWDGSRFNLDLWGQSHAELLNRAKKSYGLLADIENGSLSKSYFQSIAIDIQTGLPSFFQMAELEVVNSKAQEYLTKLLSAHEKDPSIIAEQAKGILDSAEFGDTLRNTHNAMRKANYLESLIQNPITFSLQNAHEESMLIVDTIPHKMYKNIILQHGAVTGKFVSHEVDYWSNQEQNFAQSYAMTHVNNATHLLRIAARQNAIPVLVSRCQIGPFEHKYYAGSQKFPKSQIAQRYKDDDSFYMLHCFVDYALDPNVAEHQIRHGLLQTHFVVVPSKYAREVSEYYKGADVHIYEN
jgi:hypothetical protein